MIADVRTVHQIHGGGNGHTKIFVTGLETSDGG